MGKRFWKVDERFHVVYFPNHFKYSRPENPNVLKAWIKQLDDIPDCELKCECIQQLKAFAKRWGKPFESLCQTLGVTLPKQEQESPPNPPRGNGDELSVLFDLFWGWYPRKEAKQPAWEVFQKLKPERSTVESWQDWLQRASESEQWGDKKLIPHPSTWLHQRRWEGDPPPRRHEGFHDDQEDSKPIGTIR